MRKLILIVIMGMLLSGCVNVQERDPFTINQLKGLRTYVYDVLDDVATQVGDPDLAEEIETDRDVIDTEFDGIITYEESKGDQTEGED